MVGYLEGLDSIGSMNVISGWITEHVIVISLVILDYVIVEGEIILEGVDWSSLVNSEPG